MTDRGERTVFAHEIEPDHAVLVLVSGEIDESLLDALEGYIKLHRERLQRADAPAPIIRAAASLQEAK